MSNMSQASALLACPHPFLIASDFPYVDGEKNGRLCAPSLLNTQVECCLPCPLSNAIYPNNFDSIAVGAQWLAVPGLICTVILLLSFAVLPVQRTSRHYLTICLIVAIVFLELAFVIPLGTNPDQCYDAITPHNMRSNVSCAFSGAFLLFGGFGGVAWVFIRSLSVHLQICWKYVPGDFFFYAAQIAGWGLTILFTVLALVLSGVSYRMGSTCHINHADSLVFWGPLLVLAGLALSMQFITFIYCLKVYLQVANGPKGLPSSNGTGTQVTTSSGRSVLARRATYRRIRKVIALQWRGMTVVILVLITACYLATVFLLLDQDISRAYDDVNSILPWIACLVVHNEDKKACASLTSAFVLSEEVVLPVLYLLVVCGFWCLLFLGRWGMVLGWRDLIKQKVFGGRNGSINLRSQSQQSFQNRLQSTPHQLHIIKGEEGLSVARKSEAMDIEMMSPVSPSHLQHAHYDDDAHFDDEFEEYYTPNHTQFEPLSPRQTPTSDIAPTAPLSTTNSGPTSFNFSRPTTRQTIHPNTPSFPKSTLTHPRQHSHTQSSFSQHRTHRSASDASDNWLVQAPTTTHHTPPLATPKSPKPPTRNASRRSASRPETRTPEARRSQGMAWDPTSSFASPTPTNRSAAGSPVPDRAGGGYHARGYPTLGYGVR